MGVTFPLFQSLGNSPDCHDSSNTMVSNCCPKERTVLHSSLVKIPEGGEEEKEEWWRR